MYIYTYIHVHALFYIKTALRCAELGEWLLDIRSSSYHAAFPHEPSDRKGFVVDEPQFNVVIGDIIFCNAVVIGYETDWCLKEPTACEASWTLYCIENVFTIIWVVEFILRVRAHHFSGYFKDKANWLDFGLAALSVLDVWVLHYVWSNSELELFFSAF